MIRAVLDTNVIVSSLIQPEGVPGKIRKALGAGDYIPCLSTPMFEELRDVLHRPAIRRACRIDSQEIADFLATLMDVAEWAAEPLTIEPIVREDPDDDIILATAVSGSADIIVSGDSHLLNLKTHRGIRIVSPKEFLRILRESEMQE